MTYGLVQAQHRDTHTHHATKRHKDTQKHTTRRHTHSHTSHRLQQIQTPRPEGTHTDSCRLPQRHTDPHEVMHSPNTTHVQPATITHTPEHKYTLTSTRTHGQNPSHYLYTGTHTHTPGDTQHPHSCSPLMVVLPPNAPTAGVFALQILQGPGSDMEVGGGRDGLGSSPSHKRRCLFTSVCVPLCVAVCAPVWGQNSV